MPKLVQRSSLAPRGRLGCPGECLPEGQAPRFVLVSVKRPWPFQFSGAIPRHPQCCSCRRGSEASLKAPTAFGAQASTGFLCVATNSRCWLKSKWEPARYGDDPHGQPLRSSRVSSNMGSCAWEAPSGTTPYPPAVWLPVLNTLPRSWLANRDSNRFAAHRVISPETGLESLFVGGLHSERERQVEWGHPFSHERVVGRPGSLPSLLPVTGMVHTKPSQPTMRMTWGS